MARTPSKVEVPGEEPQAEQDAAADQASPAAASKVEVLPDADDIDPATIPYGRTVMTNQGAVCSTAEPPAAPLKR